MIVVSQCVIVVFLPPGIDPRTTVVGFGVVRPQLDGVIVICQCLLVVLLVPGVTTRTAEVGFGVVRPQLDGVIVICQCKIVVSSTVIVASPSKISFGKIWLELYALRTIRNRLLVRFLHPIRLSAVRVGFREIDLELYRLR